MLTPTPTLTLTLTPTLTPTHGEESKRKSMSRSKTTGVKRRRFGKRNERTGVSLVFQCALSCDPNTIVVGRVRLLDCGGWGVKGAGHRTVDNGKGSVGWGYNE